MKLIFGLLLAFCLTPQLFAASKKGVTVYVQLSPAGSFEIKAKVKGKVKFKDGTYVAKNIYTKIKNFKTGLDLRDKHTKEKMNPGKYPKVIIEKAVGKNGKGQGIINIRGVKKKINFSFSEAGKYVKAKFKLSLKDFNFKGIKYLGVGVKDMVNVVAILPLKK